MPTVANLSPTLRQGTFDLLLIHKLHGLILCEVKAISGNASGQEIGQKLRKAVSQLDKAQEVLTHLVSDVSPGIRVSKVIALPNLTETQIKAALETNLDLTKLLRDCLGTVDSDNVIDDLICSARLHPWDVKDPLLQELRKWWQLHVACLEPDLLMTTEVYESIVARFCGPATTVTVPCTTSPRLTVKTLGQGVSKTGVYYAQLTLFPEQVDLISSEPLRVFLAGPPGTGKTVVLLLVALKWLRRNHDVYVMSTAEHSRLACCMLHHLLQQALEKMRQSGEECGQLHLLQYNFRGGTDVDRATQELTEVAKNGEVYVIVDEVGPDDVQPEKNFPAVCKTHFHSFCENLMRSVRHTHLWAASCKHGVAPNGWKLECFTRPLRSPPAVLREVEMSQEMDRLVPSYTGRGVPYPTQGPDVKWIRHESPAHSVLCPVNCQECGKEVAIFLKGLRVGDKDSQVPALASAAAAGEETSAAVSVTTSRRLPDVDYPPALEFRDVLVLCVGHVDDSSGVVQGLRRANIPLKVMESKEDKEDVATARSDVVWVTSGNMVRGIERKVVVCVRDEYPAADKYNRLYPLSRCTSQLVMVVPIPPPPVHL